MAMGGGGVKNYQKLFDVIYGRPLSATKQFRVILLVIKFEREKAEQ